MNAKWSFVMLPEGRAVVYGPEGSTFNTGTPGPLGGKEPRFEVHWDMDLRMVLKDEKFDPRYGFLEDFPIFGWSSGTGYAYHWRQSLKPNHYGTYGTNAALQLCNQKESVTRCNEASVTLRMQDDGDLVLYGYAYKAPFSDTLYTGPWVWSSKRGKNPLINSP
jgi:hypothetical protein